MRGISRSIMVGLRPRFPLHFPMSKRVSHSLLDPYLSTPIKKIYVPLRIPRAFPPEGIVLMGHLLAIVGACGFFLAVPHWWGGLLVALGVAGAHFMDCLDGTHARSTDQCRNGGELLDHFTDPLSFSYWMVGWGASTGNLWLSIIAVIVIYATAVLTNIVAKITGTFELQRFGPTEFKTLLVVHGLVMCLLPAEARANLAFWSFLVLVVVGVVQLKVNLVRGVFKVNRHGAAPDTGEWDVTASK